MTRKQRDEVLTNILLNQMTILGALFNGLRLHTPMAEEIFKQLEHTKRIIDLLDQIVE